MTVKPFPNEPDGYRAARMGLARAEEELLQQTHRVAELRRKLPLGGPVPEDYAFTALGSDGGERTVRMSELLPDGVDTLIVYSYMFSPQMERPCPMCSSVIDGLDSAATTISSRATLAVAAEASVEQLHAFARERGWSRIQLLSAAGTSYNRDYRGLDAEGNVSAALNVFTMHNGQLHHFWASESAEGAGDSEGGPVDMVWPLWNLLDLTPAGRGEDWYPGLDDRPMTLDGVREIVTAGR